MLCSKCGIENPGGAAFCKGCGNKVVAPSKEAESEIQVAEQPTQSQVQKDSYTVFREEQIANGLAEYDGKWYVKSSVELLQKSVKMGWISFGCGLVYFLIVPSIIAIICGIISLQARKQCDIDAKTKSWQAKWGIGLGIFGLIGMIVTGINS